MPKIFSFILFAIFALSQLYAGSIQGTVYNSVTLSPIADVDVFLHVLIPDSIAYQTATGVNGKYKFTGVVPNNEIYVLIAYKFGYKECYTRVDRLGSQDLTYNIYLVPDTVDVPVDGGDSSFVSGFILEPGSGDELAPVENATVSLYSSGSNTIATSDADGKYKVKVPFGSYAISVSASGFEPLVTSDLVVDTLGLTVNAILYRIALAVGDDTPLPVSFALSQAYPNPFNPTTKMSFAISQSSFVTLKVFDLLGREVAMLVNEEKQPGEYNVIWDAADMPSGVYFYRLNAGSFTGTRSLIFVK